MMDQLKDIESGNTQTASFEINRQIIHASSLYITKLEEFAYAMLELNITK